MSNQGLAIVVAIGNNCAIGRGGKLPWSIPEDMRHFREVTTGHAVIMGRKTFESIGRPLSKRMNIVVTSTAPTDAGMYFGTVIAASLEEARRYAMHKSTTPMVIGGAALYRESLPRASRIYLTEVDIDVPDADVHFDFDRSRWNEVERRAGEDPRVSFVTLERKSRRP